MRNLKEARFQIGKSGLTKGVIEALKTNFKTHKVVRISALKSSNRDKNSIKTIADEIVQKIGFSCTYKIIGFTIILRKYKQKNKI